MPVTPHMFVVGDINPVIRDGRTGHIPDELHEAWCAKGVGIEGEFAFAAVRTIILWWRQLPDWHTCAGLNLCRLRLLEF